MKITGASKEECIRKNLLYFSFGWVIWGIIQDNEYSLLTGFSEKWEQFYNYISHKSYLQGGKTKVRLKL